MKKFMMLVSLFCLPLLSQAADLNGMWVGYYAYDAGGPTTPVPCSMVLHHELDDEISGASVEPQTFGDSIEPGMPADIAGYLKGNTLDFEKYYFHDDEDAEGVRYVLTVSSDGNSLTGRWKIGDTMGTAYFRRVTAATVNRIPAP